VEFQILGDFYIAQVVTGKEGQSHLLCTSCTVVFKESTSPYSLLHRLTFYYVLGCSS
jgi:hypothetical protein